MGAQITRARPVFETAAVPGWRSAARLETPRGQVRASRRPGPSAVAGGSVVGMPPADTHHLPVLVYDGDCGLCQAAVGLLDRRVRPPVQRVAWQRSDLDALGLAPEEAQRAVCLVEPWGAVRTGAGAVAAVLCAAGGIWAIAGGALGLPGLRRAGEVAYEAVARHRHRFAPLLRTAPACATPAPGAAPGAVTGLLGR